MSIVSRVFLIVYLMALQGCSEEAPSTVEVPAIAKTEVKQALTSESKLINDVKGITAKFTLTELPLGCLEFEEVDELIDAKHVVDVREKHGGTCKGDPSTSPRLFSVAIDQETGEAWSDAKSATGNLELLEEQ